MTIKHLCIEHDNPKHKHEWDDIYWMLHKIDHSLNDIKNLIAVVYDAENEDLTINAGEQIATIINNIQTDDKYIALLLKGETLNIEEGTDNG